MDIIKLLSYIGSKKLSNLEAFVWDVTVPSNNVFSDGDGSRNLGIIAMVLAKMPKLKTFHLKTGKIDADTFMIMISALVAHGKCIGETFTIELITPNKKNDALHLQSVVNQFMKHHGIAQLQITHSFLGVDGPTIIHLEICDSISDDNKMEKALPLVLSMKIKTEK